MLGSALALALSRDHEVTASASRDFDGAIDGAARSITADLADGGAELLASHCSPDAVVNCAAMTDVDACETHTDAARAINGRAPAALAEAFGGAYIVHISTDAVFGPGVSFADEATPPSPMSAYGATKLEGERALLSAAPSACVLRTTVVGVGGRRRQSSLAEWMIGEMRARRPVRLFTDALFTPISVWDFVPIVEWALANRPQGVWHAAGGERVSKHDFGVMLASACGYDAAIERARLADLPGASIRRTDQSLSSRRLEAASGIRMPSASSCVESIAWRLRG